MQPIPPFRHALFSVDAWSPLFRVRVAFRKVVTRQYLHRIFSSAASSVHFPLQHNPSVFKMHPLQELSSFSNLVVLALNSFPLPCLFCQFEEPARETALGVFDFSFDAIYPPPPQLLFLLRTHVRSSRWCGTNSGKSLFFYLAVLRSSNGPFFPPLEFLDMISSCVPSTCRISPTYRS